MLSPRPGKRGVRVTMRNSSFRPFAAEFDAGRLLEAWSRCVIIPGLAFLKTILMSPIYQED